MGRQSSVDKLPRDILEQLQALLRDPRVTQLDATAKINAILSAEGRPERVSKSAVNRYSVRMEEVGKKLRESREIAEMWIAKVGAAPQGQLGHLVNEMLRSLAFDLTLKLQDNALAVDDMPAVIDMLKQLSLAVQRLETGATLNVKREAEIRKQEREAVANEIAEEAKAQGMDDEQAKFWRRKVLGVK